MIEIIGEIGRMATKEEINSFKETKYDITPELVTMSRNIIRQYASGIDALNCHECIFYESCEEDFASCPCEWEDLKQKRR